MNPRCTLVLHALQRAGDHGMTTGELVEAGGSRFGARIAELRDAGYSISQHRERQSSHRYKLTAGPPPSTQSEGEQRRVVFATEARCLRCGLGGQDPDGECTGCDNGLLLSAVGYGPAEEGAAA